MKSTLIMFATALLGLGFATNCDAAIMLNSVVGGQPFASANYVTFNADTNSGNQWSNTTGTDFVTVNIVPGAIFVTGSLSGRYAAPFLSGNNGVNFGLDGIVGQDATQYLTSGRDAMPTLGAKVEVKFNRKQRYFGLLWGSVDSYNTLKFFNGADLVGTITGSQVTASATGDQGLNGTYYVNMISNTGFNRVEMISSQYAFEFDNIAYSAVPEPTSLAVWSVFGLAGLIRRRRV